MVISIQRGFFHSELYLQSEGRKGCIAERSGSIFANLLEQNFISYGF